MQVERKWLSGGTVAGAGAGGAFLPSLGKLLFPPSVVFSELTLCTASASASRDTNKQEKRRYGWGPLVLSIDALASLCESIPFSKPCHGRPSAWLAG
jgi:hypothetical protein